MKKFQSILSITFLIFHLLLFFIVIYINYRSTSHEFILSLQSKTQFSVFFTGFGFLLFLLNYLVSFLEKRNFEREKIELVEKINAIKAKMFDLKESIEQKKQNDIEKKQDNAEKNHKE